MTHQRGAGPSRWLLAGLLVAAPVCVAASESQAPTIVRVERLEADGRFRWLPEWRAASAPHWGIALGGGGTWGLAHLGLLEAMHEDGLQPRMVAGTSAGALVGAAVATGLAPRDVEAIFREAERDPRRSLGGVAGGGDGPVDPLSSLGAGGRAGRTVEGRRPPWRGLIPTTKISNELVRYFGWASARSDGDLDRLALPFRAVTTDVDRAEIYAPSRGSLPDLVRASIGLPVFAPVVIDGRRLVDGGVLEEVPVPTVRAMGAELVVGVRLTRNGGGASEASSERYNFRRLAARYDALTLEEHRRGIFEQADVRIPIAVGSASPATFRGQIDDLLASGREAWEQARPTTLEALEQASPDLRRFRLTSLAAGPGTDPAIAEEMAARLALDGVPRELTALRLELELVRRLRSGEHADAWLELSPDGAARLIVVAERPITDLVVAAPAVLAGTFDDIEVGSGSFPAPLLAEIERRLLRARQNGWFLAEVQAVSWDRESGRLEIRVSQGIVDGVDVADGQNGDGLPTPTALSRLVGRPADFRPVRRALRALQREERLVEPRVVDVRRTGAERYRLIVAAQPPPRWEVDWNLGLADGLGPALWLRGSVPRLTDRWSSDSRLVGGREGLLGATELLQSTGRHLRPFVRAIGGRLALPLYDDRGNFVDERRFDYAALAVGARSFAGGWGEGELAVASRWVDEEAFVDPAERETEGADVGLELSWGQRFGDDPVEPVRRLAWTVEGSFPFAGEERDWVASATVEAATTVGQRRRWSLEVLGQASDAGDDDPLPVDRWLEAGSWLVAPPLSPGQSRARSLRRGTLVVRRSVSGPAGLPLNLGGSIATWRLAEQRVDLALERRGHGASAFVELSLGPGSIRLGAATGDQEGDSLFFVFGPARLPWPGTRTRLPGK